MLAHRPLTSRLGAASTAVVLALLALPGAASARPAGSIGTPATRAETPSRITAAVARPAATDQALRALAIRSEALNQRYPAARHATGAARAPGSVDLRSPDARDAARFAGASRSTDLRSPDARDAEASYHPRGVRNVGRAAAIAPTSPSAPSSGTNWGDVGLIAAGGLVLLLAGLAVLARAADRPARMPAPRNPAGSR